MAPTRRPGTPARSAATGIFDRVLVGVDGTTQGFDACRQAARLAGPDSTLAAVAVVQLAPGITETLERAGAASLVAARRILGPRAEVRKLYGLVVPQLLDEVERVEATLLAIGSHDHPRPEEILLGGVAGELLHEAPCSVLLARPVPSLATFPAHIVVGVDGSGEADRAWEVAAGLATRFHSTLRSVVALEGRHVDVAALRQRHPEVEGVAAAPVQALADAAERADLLVVGSRGLHGLRALGSVSERIAHRAGCPVLVVRGAAAVA